MNSLNQAVTYVTNSISNKIAAYRSEQTRAGDLFNCRRPVVQAEIIGKTTAVALGAGFVGSFLFSPLVTTVAAAGLASKAFVYFVKHPKEYSLVKSGSENANAADAMVKPVVEATQKAFHGAIYYMQRAIRAVTEGAKHAWTDIKKAR